MIPTLETINPMKKQLELFKPELKREEPLTYSGLSIHQKINYKANQCGFQRVVYKSFYNYYRHPVRKRETEKLRKEYLTHYYMNAGGDNRIDTWRKSQSLF